jgi:FkbM family methyltransferase
MRNYPQYWYRSSDIVADDLSWINEFDICVVNGVIDVMEDHVGVLSKILTHCKEYLIIHRQEITENGTTHTITNGSYGGKTYHSIFNRSDFNEILDKHNFDIIKEIPLEFANWENGGSSFLLRKRRSYALYGMDYKLNDLFDRKESGVFIECGANDGVRQSNTLFLERYKNWSGILIEPVTQQFNWCRENRSSVNHFVNCALVSNEYNSPFADILYTPECYGLMTVVNDERGRKRMVDVGEYHEAQKVPAKTLSTVMNEAGITHADLFVLDVEGYELDVLKGCDFDKYKIDYLLIEELGGGTAIMDYLSPWYTRVSNLSVHDILYKRIC